MVRGGGRSVRGVPGAQEQAEKTGEACVELRAAQPVDPPGALVPLLDQPATAQYGPLGAVATIAFLGPLVIAFAGS